LRAGARSPAQLIPVW